MDRDAVLAIAIAAAVRGGRHLASLARAAVEVLSGEGRDLKISADRSSERLILETLEERAGYPTLTEESGGLEALPRTPAWVVDPLDGSANFARGIPGCCVSVALVDDGEPVVGAVYDLDRDELFSGAVGVGAWQGTASEPRLAGIRTSTTGHRHDAYLATGLPVARDFGGDALEALVRELQQFKKVRMLGAAALSLAYVAAGRVDAYAEDGIRLWDVAAGVALVRAAGGWARMTPLASPPWACAVRAAGNESLWKMRDNEGS